jgi:hypothetical protein
LDRVLSGLEATRRLEAWTAAEKQRLLAQLQTRQDLVTDPDDKEWLGDEVGAVLHVAGGSARMMMHDAAQLTRTLPTSHQLLAAGILNPVQVRDLIDATRDLSADAASDVEARVLARAGEQTNGQFRVSLRRAVNAVAPMLAEQRHVRAVADRAVKLYPGENGMSTLWGLLPTPHAIRVMTAINCAADDAKKHDEQHHPADGDGSIDEFVRADQYRADALLELAERYLAGTDPTGKKARQRAEIRVTVALSTLLGLDDQPAELTDPTGRNFGPIPASLARQLATHPDSRWRRLVTDPLGGLLDYGRTRYRPPKKLDKFVKTRTPTCAFPTCNRPADNTELDHVRDWNNGGPTRPENLLPLCARHHHLKHETNWHLHYNPTTGIATWTSPTGRKYTNTNPPLPTGGSD